MDEAQFVKQNLRTCLHKVQIKNPYTDEIILVPCGTCPACLLNRATHNDIRCRAQQYLSKYCYFITLTYDVNSIPLYRISCNDSSSDPDVSRLYTISSVPDSERPIPVKKGVKLPRRDVFTDSFCAVPAYVDRYCRAADLTKRKYFIDNRLKDCYPYLCWNDVSVFMKRFRKNLFNITHTYEKIHSYIVGEYGPRTFRPHWHLLLFFESDRLSESIESALYQSWTFGRIDFSAARKDAASYVASYTNSFTTTPYHLRVCREVRPRSRFSNGFASDCFRSLRGYIQSESFSKISTSFSFSQFGRSFVYRPRRQDLDSYIYPGVRAARSTPSSVVQVITSIRNIFTRPFSRIIFRKRSSWLSVSRAFVKYLFRSYIKLTTRSLIAADPYLRTFFTWIHVDWNNFFKFFCSDGYNLLVSSVYRQLSTLSKFLHNMCDCTIFDFDYNKCYSSIVLSFKYLRYEVSKNLKVRYSNLAGYPCDCGRYFWKETPETLSAFRSTGIGKRLLEAQQLELLNSLKHRETNDLYFMSYV